MVFHFNYEIGIVGVGMEIGQAWNDFRLPFYTRKLGLVFK